MATEGGSDLRECMCRAVYSFANEDGLIDGAESTEIVDAILEAIDEAGMVIVERKAAAILLGATADQYDMMDACLYANDLYRLQREAESGQLQTLFHRDWAKDQYDLDRGAGRG